MPPASAVTVEPAATSAVHFGIEMGWPLLVEMTVATCITGLSVRSYTATKSAKVVGMTVPTPAASARCSIESFGP